MRGKSLALLVLALGCGLVASIGITQVMAKRKTQKDVSSGDTETIFVALEDIGLGEPLTAQMLRLEQWPKDKVPTEALTRIEDVEGRRTKTKLYAGEPILENKLFSKGDRLGGVTPMIPKGYRVVSVKVDSTSSSGNLIRPGDRVDVMVHLRQNPGMGILETTTRTILQDIKVFAVNDVVEVNSEQHGGKTIAAKTISLLVTPEDAEKLILATQLGAIQLVMRGPDDDEHVVTDGTPAYELFGQTKPVGRQNEDPGNKPDVSKHSDEGFFKFLKQAKAGATAAQRNPVVPDQHNKHEMRVMIGPEVKLVVLEAQGDQPDAAAEGGFWRVSELGEESVFDSDQYTATDQQTVYQPEPGEEGDEEQEDEEEPDDT